jgi:hypothetical protein
MMMMMMTNHINHIGCFIFTERDNTQEAAVPSDYERRRRASQHTSMSDVKGHSATSDLTHLHNNHLPQDGTNHRPKPASSTTGQNSSQQTCIRCEKAPRRVVFLPCGHQIACPECADVMEKCAVCDRTILATCIPEERRRVDQKQT